MRKRFLILITLIITLVAIGYFEFGDLVFPPKTRLSSGQNYKKMKPSDNFHYIDLQVDNYDTSGTFVGYYKLSPGYKKSENVIFVLTDGQQELVGPNDDFEFFENRLKGLSYVLIGVRGQKPMQFPEVYTESGAIDLAKAMYLYSSKQQVEDIENIRKDMIKKGLLSKEQKIMLYGGSGGGILIQQYLSKYGDNVSRSLIESSGIPESIFDNFRIRMKEKSPETLEKFDYIVKSNMVNKNQFFWILNKIAHDNLDYEKMQIELINNIYEKKYMSYYKYLMKPAYNYHFIKMMIAMPIEDVVRVRMYEVYGNDIIKYKHESNIPVNITLEYMSDFIKDFITAAENKAIPLNNFDYLKSSREKYNGEVLIMSGTRDSVFNNPNELSSSYKNSKLCIFEDKHVLERYPEYYYSIRKAFFIDGLHSKELSKLMQDSRQLNIEK